MAVVLRLAGDGRMAVEVQEVGKEGGLGDTARAGAGAHNGELTTR